MGKVIVAFGASSSKESINKKLANYAAHQIEGASINLLDLNDYEMPIFNVDLESREGIPSLAHQFKDELRKADGIIISFAEHNSNFSAAYKNIFDWISRIEKDVWLNKPMFLMATSPGGRGGASVLAIAVNAYSYSNKNTIVQFSLPLFNENFSDENGIQNAELKKSFNEQLSFFKEAL